MKKLLVLFLALAIIVAIPVGTVSFAESEDDWTEFEVRTENGQVYTGEGFKDKGYEMQITNYEGSATDLEIPGVIKGHPVILRHLPSNVTSMVVGEGAYSVAEAFKGNINLKYICLPEDIRITNDAFNGCSSNLLILAPYGSYPETYAKEHGIKFLGGYTKKAANGHVVFWATAEDGGEFLTDSGFQYLYTFEKGKCMSMIMGYTGSETNIVTPNLSELALGIDDTLALGSLLGSWSMGVFTPNENITSVIIGEGTNYITTEAFSNHPNLKAVYIPNSVEKIVEGSFLGCSTDLIIYGQSGSFAENYANANGIQFQAVSGPSEVPTPAEQPSQPDDGQNQQGPASDNSSNQADTSKYDGSGNTESNGDSPATGVEGMAVAIAIATISLGGLLISKKVKK